MINRLEEFDTLVSSIYKNLLKIKRREMAKFGLKSTHAQCMMAMSQHPEGVTVTQLVELCCMDKAAISRAVAEMEEHGVILPRNCGDRNYRVPLLLSDKGNDLVHQISNNIHDMMISNGYGANEGDRDIHYTILRQVNANLAALAQADVISENHKGDNLHEQ